MKPWEQLKEDYIDYDTDRFIDGLVREDMQVSFKCPVQNLQQIDTQMTSCDSSDSEYQYINSLSNELKQTIDNVVSKSQNLNDDNSYFNKKEIISVMINCLNQLSCIDGQLTILNDVKNMTASTTPHQQLILNTLSL